jgi:DNA polymerase-3 subunit gamma/tau
MDNFIVSARKYRPDSFDTVVGQDAITKTLKNSIKINQLAQAYLFCGPRGVGKTTCARIFAKTINCYNPGPDHEACNECESCVAFNNLRSLNIHELDAASNNSVDDIRNLIDQVRIPPQIGKYSVYIIDEVHMLTSSAFNAFLKTLEEPPKHVIFIMATTEKHKIIPTILSRCQIFDFNRISVEDIRKRLEFVAQREGVEAEQDALHIIAQKADGAMRDALSIFDQIVSFTGKHVTYQETIKNLNVLDYETYFRLTRQLVAGDYVSVLQEFDAVLKKGFEAGYFISGLASHFRDLLVCKDPGTIDLLEVGQKAKQDYLENSQICSVSFLFRAIKIANDCDLNYKASLNKRLLVEMALLQICNIQEKISSQTTVQYKVETSNKPASQVSEPQAQVQQTNKTNQQPPVNQENTKSEQKAENTPKASPVDIQKEEKTQEEKQQEEKPQSHLMGFKGSLTGISIASLTKSDTTITKQKTQDDQDQEEQEDDYDEIIGTDSFSQEKLNEKWNSYIETLQEDERIYNFLKNSVLTKTEGNTYSLNVDSSTLKKSLEMIKPETVLYMQKALNNKDFIIEYILSETTHIEKVYKTDREKLQDMINDNPNIQTLADKLELDFE